ncbi:MAG: permease prefix domain 1-containing protein [Phycisphaerales bacterium JB040]
MTTSPRTKADPVAPSRRDPINDWLDVFIRLLELKPSESRAVRDELEDHLRSRVDDLIITGVGESDAVRTAVAELGETAILAKRFKHAQHPSRRRTLMSTALVAVAASALTLGAFSFMSPPGSITATAGQAAPNSIIALADPPEGEVAPFNERLRRYDLRPLGLPTDVDHSGQEVIAERALEELRETIMHLVHTDAWEDMGGDTASYSTYASTLFIEGDPETHEGVRWVMAGLIKEAEERAAAREARRAENEAVTEASIRAEQQRREQQQARAEAERRQRLAELETQYHDLTERFIELTRELARLEQEQGAIESQIRSAAMNADVMYSAEMGSVRERITVLERERDMLVDQVVSEKAANEINHDRVKELETRLHTVQQQIQSAEEQVTVIRQKTVQATQEQQSKLGNLKADFVARRAELELRYDDTEVRLTRVRSVLLDLELAEYTGGNAASPGYINQSWRAGAIQDRADEAIEPAGRLYRGDANLRGFEQSATTDRTISIAGNVARAGTYQLPEGDTNLARMLAAAGAEPSDSLYARLIRADDQVWSAKLAEALNQDNEDSPTLYPGDRIVIGPSPFAR